MIYVFKCECGADLLYRPVIGGIGAYCLALNCERRCQIQHIHTREIPRFGCLSCA